jgi:histidyl-tRNA synthetase
MLDITIAIDKLDKIGIDKVKDELAQRGLSGEQISIIEQYLSIDGTNEEKLRLIENLLQGNEQGKTGLEELRFVLNYSTGSQVGNSNLIIDFTLARGLNYYTGVIFEAKAPATVKIGSIGGGGRYDDLTGLFGVPNIPGVGISFGVDRIYDVLEELKLFPETVAQGTKVLFFNLGEAECKTAFSLMQQLRNKGVAAELFHESAKMDKQFKYAEKKGIPYVVIIGTKELESGTCNLKDLRSGEQRSLQMKELLEQAFN